MCDTGSDSACCAATNPVENVNDSDIFSDGFEIGHWNVDPAGENLDSNDNVGVSSGDTVSYMDRTVLLEFPKFSKGLKTSDFKEFVRVYVGEDNVERLENWRHPHVWMLAVKNKEIREKLLRMWKTKIKNKNCWIVPYHDYEMRGFLHWCPHFISDDDIKTQLSQFGEVLVLENESHHHWNSEIKSDLRYFGLRLKDGMVKNDLPHFLKFEGYRTLVIVRGRQTACFHCREFGHRKKDCKMYKERLDGYCKNLEAKPRTKPRGRRHRPASNDKNDGHDSKTPVEMNQNSSSILAQENVEPCLKHTSLVKKMVDDKEKEEILAVLESLKDWKELTTGMVEQTLTNTEQKLKTNLSQSERTELEKESIEVVIKLSLDEMKETVISMIEKTLDNLKNLLTDHFGLDSNEPLEKLIRIFETTKK